MSTTGKRGLWLAACAGMLLGCGLTEERELPSGETAAPAEQQTGTPRGEAQTGTATVYAGMLEGRETAGGEAFSHEELVAAHRTFPLGTQVQVTNLENDRSVTVRIVDRTPAGTDAIIDLSQRSARELGIGERGQAPVRLEVVD